MNQFSSRYGPWAVVAGASEGLGAEFAKQLAESGVNLLLIARQAALLSSVAEDIRHRYGVEVRCLTQDLADAGLARINVQGPVTMVRALAPAMCERSRGAVVLVSSLAGMQGSPGITAYAASKAFNTILAEGLWVELGEQNIDVVVSCAGAMPTPGYQRAFNMGAPGMLDPAEVAKRTLRALGRGPRFIPGAINRMAAFLTTRLLPRRAAIRVIGRSTRRLL